MNFPREFLSRPDVRSDQRNRWRWKIKSVPCFPPPFNVGQLLLVESLAEKSNLFQTCTAAFAAAVSFSALLVRQRPTPFIPSLLSSAKLVCFELYRSSFFHVRLVQSNPLILHIFYVTNTPRMFRRFLYFYGDWKKERKKKRNGS